MKHTFKITLVILAMFLLAQFLGLFIVSVYQSQENKLPFNMEPPPEFDQEKDSVKFLPSILIAFIFAITLFFVLTKINAEKFIKIWFFLVASLAMGIALKAFYLFIWKDYYLIFSILSQPIVLSIVSIGFFAIALYFAYLKIFKRYILIHNITELLIYPGIAAVFISILGVIGIIILLLLISLYDIWAVWHSNFMEKMANYQINNLKFFTGFFIPYASKQEKQKIKNIKEKYSEKSEKFLEEKFKRAKIKVNLAILGGGDIIFPIITAGVFIKVFGSVIPGLVISVFSTVALFALFLLARKGKFYPAMPFLTIGIYLAMIFNWLFVV